MPYLGMINLGMISLFILGYVFIIFEHRVKINKACIALLVAVLLWLMYFIANPHAVDNNISVLMHHISDISQIVFFLIGAMAIVEVIDVHKGFKIVTDFINTQSKRKLLWLMGALTFFMSAVLDNLTSAIVVVSLLRKLIPDKKERMLFACMAIIAANAGGAWTPIGDVTTTMLWINGQITSLSIMKALFLPSLVAVGVSFSLQSFKIEGRRQNQLIKYNEIVEPKGKIIFFVGLAALLSVPILKALTGLPPFMGMLIGLSVVWLVTDLVHQREGRGHLKVPYVLSKIDTSGVLFFLGILLAIKALETIGLLRNIAMFLDQHIASQAIVANTIGLFSAIIDNVPLVAACMGMYDLSAYPVNSHMWEMIAYCAGTGGSILIIGSAAGVAVMGLEEVDFIWYLKHISLIALIGYFAGFIAYAIMQMF